MLEAFIKFVAAHKPYFDAAHALAAVVNLLGWTLGGTLLYLAWRRNAVQSVNVGPMTFQLQQQAVEAAATAARDWEKRASGKPVDVPQLRRTVSRAFEPDHADRLIGKAILWVDDNPSNNLLALRALHKLGLDIEQQVSTEAGIEAMTRRHFDLVISDMGRGTNLRAGYELLDAVRRTRPDIPFLIFAGSDTPEFRAEAETRGAQLSTNDMIELLNTVIDQLAA